MKFSSSKPSSFKQTTIVPYWLFLQPRIFEMCWSCNSTRIASQERKADITMRFFLLLHWHFYQFSTEKWQFLKVAWFKNAKPSQNMYSDLIYPKRWLASLVCWFVWGKKKRSFWLHFPPRIKSLGKRVCAECNFPGSEPMTSSVFRQKCFWFFLQAFLPFGYLRGSVACFSCVF